MLDVRVTKRREEEKNFFITGKHDLPPSFFPFYALPFTEYFILFRLSVTRVDKRPQQI
jgi:hypothetical protein